MRLNRYLVCIKTNVMKTKEEILAEALDTIYKAKAGFPRLKAYICKPCDRIVWQQKEDDHQCERCLSDMLTDEVRDE